jgi:protein SCO1/2
MRSTPRAPAAPISTPTIARQSKLVILVGLLVAISATANAANPLPVHDGVGGAFSAPSSLGREVSLAEFRDKVVLLFFGYTSCQDVCPATLAHLQSLVHGLGDTADAVQVLFVTVDPENDSADHLAQYLARFDSRFVGLTGTREETDRIASLFMVKHDRSHGVEVSNEYNRGKTFTDRSYLYSHSQQIYLLDKLGRTRALFFTGSPLEEMRGAIIALLNE